MLKLLCSKCEVELQPARSGVSVIEYFSPNGFGKPPLPYKLWQADEYECPHCHYKVVTGFAKAAVHHNEDGFAAELTFASSSVENVRHDFQSLRERAAAGHIINQVYPEPLPDFPTMAFAYIMLKGRADWITASSADMLMDVGVAATNFIDSVRDDESDEAIAATAAMLGNAIVNVLDTHHILGEAGL